MKNVFSKLNRFFDNKWKIAILDMENGRWILKAKSRFIPYLKAENANGRHILIQPGVETEYLMADDIDECLLTRHHKCNKGRWKPGRMIVETSPDNYQVWIRSSRKLSLNEKRYWLKKLKSDPGADPNNRMGRCPGFRNRKEKYRDSMGGYPLARLIWVDWTKKADIPPIHHKSKSSPVSLQTLSPQPLEGGVCHRFISHVSRRIRKPCRPISRNDYDRRDESATDMAYALALFRRQFSRDQIKEKIISERSNWKNHKGERRMNAYLERTIAKAEAIVRIS